MPDSPVRCRIPEHLRRIGKTQQWLADSLGMPKSQLSDYVTLRNVLGLTKARDIARLLGVPIEDLYEWD